MRQFLKFLYLLMAIAFLHSISGCSGFLEVFLYNRTNEPVTVEFLTMECKVTVPANSEVNTGCKHFTENIGLRYRPENGSTWVEKNWRYKELSRHALRHSRFNLELP